MARPRPDAVARLLEGRPRPLVIAHRGASADAPENTLAAFARARDAGILAVELDVYRCATGEVVVCHDPTLDRTGGVALSLTASPLEALREHSVGAWFAPEFASERIPLLEQVVELMGPDAFFDIEIKHTKTSMRRALPDSMEAVTVELIRRHGLAERAIVSSFDPFVVRRVRALAPEVHVAVIYVDSTEMPRTLRRGGGRIVAGAAVMKPHWPQATHAHVARHHRRGRLVMPWTVDDEETAIAVAEQGADAIITNRPAAIAAALAPGR